MFAVIEADLEYDYLAGLNFVMEFPTTEEAESYIRNQGDIVTQSWEAKHEYIKRYLESVEDPEPMKHEEWMEFCKGFGVGSFAFRYYRQTFKQEIRSEIVQQKSLPRGDYHPPATLYNRELHVVEIPS